MRKLKSLNAKNKLRHKKILCSLLTCCMPFIPGVVFAQDQPVAQDSFDPVTVTALRYESKDLDTPADVTSYTGEQLAATGAVNVIEALKNATGVIYSAMGPHGQSWSSMSGKLVMRGVENGTLVLVNGVPVNLNGIYYLDQMPLDQVQKIEIVKGAGSVLYGSEAFGGVINIITKTNVANTVTVSGGSDGQNHSLTLQTGKASWLFDYGKTNETDPVTDFRSTKGIGPTSGYVNYDIVFGDSTKKNFAWNYQFDDALTLHYSHSDNDYSIFYKGTSNDILRNYSYQDKKNLLQLNYQKDGWTSKAYYNDLKLTNTSVEPARSGVVSWGNYKNSVYGLDTQKTWRTGNTQWLGGFTTEREHYEQDKQDFTGYGPARKLTPLLTTGPFDRNHYAIYGQWDQKVSDKTRVILSAREDKVNAERGLKYSAFCPQFQTVTKIDDRHSWYTNIGKSFETPTFSQMYLASATFTANPDLRPETGLNEEVGYKMENGHSKWKAALFHTTMDDMIVWKTINGKYTAQNLASFRNTGVELSYSNQLSDQFSLNIGGSFGNPEAKESSGAAWQRTMGRTQISTSLNYQSGPWAATLSGVYLCGRADDDSGAAIKPMLPVMLHVAYQTSKTSTITFDVDNLLNRRDNNNGSTTSPYFTLPRTYRVGFSTHF